MGASDSITVPPPEELVEVLADLRSRPPAAAVVSAELRAMDISRWYELFDFVSAQRTRARIARTLAMDLGRYPGTARVDELIGFMGVGYCSGADAELHVEYLGDRGTFSVTCGTRHVGFDFADGGEVVVVQKQVRN